MPTLKNRRTGNPLRAGGHHHPRRAARGHRHPHYCWHPGLSVAANCRMCLVEVLPPPGRPAMTLDILRWDAGQERLRPRQEAQAPARLPADLRARHGGALRVEPPRRRGAQRRAGAPAPQPPGRLPHLRSGRRVPPAGLLARARPQAEAHARGAGAQAQGRRLRAHHRLRRRALHRLHALHPRLGGARQGSGALAPRARQPERGRRSSPGRAARPRLHADDRARVPGRRAHLQRLPLQGARLVPPQRAHRLPGLRHRLQRLPRLRPAQQHALPPPPAGEHGGQQVLDVRRGHALVQARGGRPAPLGARRRRRRHHRGRALGRQGPAQGPRQRPLQGRRRPLRPALQRGQLRHGDAGQDVPRRGRLLRLRPPARARRRHPHERGQEPQHAGRDADRLDHRRRAPSPSCSPPSTPAPTSTSSRSDPSSRSTPPRPRRRSPSSRAW